MPPIQPKSLLKMLAGKSKETPGTGMKDDVGAVIDGQAPAALSAGEFVVPADVISLIGDGNNEAGSQIMEQVIAEIRGKKTGQKGQPNPMAELFKGGKVKGKYAAGGKVMQDVNKNQKIAPPKEPPNVTNLASTMRRFTGGIA